MIHKVTVLGTLQFLIGPFLFRILRNKEVVKRRLLSTEGVFAMGETSIAVLERKYAGGIATELRAQQKIDAANAVELEMKMNEEGGGQNGGK